MKVTVIIPTAGHRPEYLEEAIASCEAQTYPDLEVLVIHTLQTVGQKVNEGVKKATGELICILADDDILPPTSIADRVEAIGDFDILHANALLFGAVNRTYEPPDKRPSLASLLAHNSIHAGTVMLRKDCFTRFGGYDENLWTAEEYDYHLRLLSKGCSITYLDKIVHHYRRHEGQKSLGNKDSQYQLARQNVITGIRNRYK